MPLGNPTLVRWVSLGSVRHRVTFSRHSCEPKHVSIIWKISFILCVFVRVLTFTNCDKTDMREEGIENRARIIWGNVLLSEQYYPILDVGALGRRSWLWSCREGLGFIFRQVQAKGRLPSTAFTLNTSCSSLSGRQASLKRHVHLARGGQLILPSLELRQNITSATLITANAVINKVPKLILGNKRKDICRCLHMCKCRKSVFPTYGNSFNWCTVKPKIHGGAGPTAQRCNVTNPGGTPAAINSQSQQQWPHPPHHFHYGWWRHNVRLTLPTECHLNFLSADAVKNMSFRYFIHFPLQVITTAARWKHTPFSKRWCAIKMVSEILFWQSRA